MRCAIPALFLFIFSLFRSPAAADNTVIEQMGVTIGVPTPEGFAKLDGKSEEVAGLNRMFDGFGCDLLAVYLRSGRTGGRAGDYDHQYDISAIKGMPSSLMRKVDISRLRQREIREREWRRKETEARLGITGMVIEAIDDPGDRHYSHLKIRPEADGKKSCNYSTMALIRGRLWLICTRTLKADDPKEIEWCKAAGKAWVASILQANPSDAATLAKEEEPENGEKPEKEGKPAEESMFEGAGKWAVPGAIIVALAVVFLKMRKNRQTA